MGLSAYQSISEAVDGIWIRCQLDGIPSVMDSRVRKSRAGMEGICKRRLTIREHRETENYDKGVGAM